MAYTAWLVSIRCTTAVALLPICGPHRALRGQAGVSGPFTLDDGDGKDDGDDGDGGERGQADRRWRVVVIVVREISPYCSVRRLRTSSSSTMPVQGVISQT